ncbi:MAG: flagellar hook-associated protein FlgK [Burkholderiaceae bacterium]
MGSSILSIGQSALAAAQAGLGTTGHNIANAATPGYSRQVVVQASAGGQNYGFGFIGQGTQVDTVKRIYSDFIGTQINSTQSAKSGLDSYYTQISQIDNLLADPSAGLSPALQDFFQSVQDLAANPNAAASRQSVLSEGQALVARFQSLNQQVDDIRTGVNSQIGGSVTAINSYAQQIASLNEAISKATGGTGQPPNDLLDQRDQLVADLSKQVGTTVVRQDGNTYNVFIGNGQALVLGAQTFTLQAVQASDDPSRIAVAYQSNGSTTVLADNSLTGGTLGGLLQFRDESLDAIQNSIGRTAIALASAFNAQHRAGQDLNGNPGGDFFSIGTPIATPDVRNTSSAQLSVSIASASALTTSDYRVQYDGTNYRVTALPNGTPASYSSLPQTIGGVTIALAPSSGTPNAGDSFLIKPVANGAATIDVAITNTGAIAAGGQIAPFRAAAGASNTGTGAVSAPAVDPAYVGAPLASTAALTYAAATGTISANAPVAVTVGGVTTNYAVGAAIPYTSGASYSFNGVAVTVTGAPADGDVYTVAPNASTGDNSNALRLAALQTANIVAGGTTTLQGAYSQLVSLVGNKTRELEVTSTAEGQQLASAVARQQSESGVNLDEEATNLIRYQQAYQAAAKVMATAGKLFDTLLTLGS